MLTLSCTNANNYGNKQNNYIKLKHKTIHNHSKNTQQYPVNLNAVQAEVNVAGNTTVAVL